MTIGAGDELKRGWKAGWVEGMWHAQDQDSGDTAPCKVTPVILHGVGDTTPCRTTAVTVHGVDRSDFTRS